MKKSLIVILSTILVLASFKVKGQVTYDKYFTDNQLRIDYYLFGNADTLGNIEKRGIGENFRGKIAAALGVDPEKFENEILKKNPGPKKAYVPKETPAPEKPPVQKGKEKPKKASQPEAAPKEKKEEKKQESTLLKMFHHLPKEEQLEILEKSKEEIEERFWSKFE